MNKSQIPQIDKTSLRYSSFISLCINRTYNGKAVIILSPQIAYFVPSSVSRNRRSHETRCSTTGESISLRPNRCLDAYRNLVYLLARQTKSYQPRTFARNRNVCIIRSYAYGENIRTGGLRANVCVHAVTHIQQYPKTANRRCNVVHARKLK